MVPSFRECHLIFISEGVAVGELEDARVVVIVCVPVHSTSFVLKDTGWHPSHAKHQPVQYDCCSESLPYKC